MNKLILQSKLAGKVVVDVLGYPLRLAQAAGLFFIFILLLQWLFQPSVFWQIITNSALSVADKLDVIIDGFFNVFRLIDDLTPISFILIALLQALSLVIWLQLRSEVKSSGRKQLASLGLGLIGSGCVACGGSVLSPILSSIATGISVSAAEAVGDVVLVLAVIFSVRAFLNISSAYATSVKLAP